jgi:hypothetical protein
MVVVHEAPMTSAQEHWAFAAKLMEKHGHDIGVFIMARIAELRRRDDEGIHFWISVADKVMQLAEPDDGAWVQ